MELGNDIVVMDSEGSIKGDVHVSIPPTNTKTCTNAKNHDAPTSSDDVAIKNVLDISFPRCSVCQTEWFGRQIEEEEDDDGNKEDEKLPALTSSDNRKRKHQHTRREALFPMPKCGCSTRLALPNNLPSAIFSSSTECNGEHPTKVLSKVQTHTFPNLAICGSCLKRRIKTSEEVLEHDYRQQHIPNGQQNVKFTVDPNCVQCKQKFMPRVLERLLQSEDAQPEKSSNKKRKGEPDVNWYDAVETTIQLVGWAKCESYRERRKLRQYKRAKKMNHISCVEGCKNNNEQKIECWWKNQNGFTGGDTGSSDECYSLPSDSSVGDDSDDDNYSKRRKGVHRVAAKSGEIFQELMQKDPKFKQEVENEQLVKKLLEEEDERRKEAEAKDHEMAMKLQEELDKQAKQPIEPIKTRRSKNNNPIASDPFSHASASAKKRGRKKSSKGPGSVEPPQSEPQPTAIASAATAQTNHDASTSKEDDDINHMVAMGFTEASSRRCLKDAEGNLERAVRMLLSEASENND